MKSPALPTDLDLGRRRRLVSRTLTLCRESEDLALWVLGARVIDGRPFSFEGHEYLYDIYRDRATQMVIRKAAQMGASEYAISRALHFAVRNGGRIMYYFPTKADVLEFSRDRFAPAVHEVPYLRALVGATNNDRQRQIAKAFIYFRGTVSRTGMKSVPADFLIFDEVDEMVPANMELAHMRLGHSKEAAELFISTPTLPGYGIDRFFEASDQRHWYLKCPGCSRDWCLEDLFLEHHGSPEDPRREIVFVKGEAGRETLVCMTCGKTLDPAKGRWAAKFPSRSSHGYALPKFLSQVVSRADMERGCLTKPAALLRDWQTTPFPSEFYTSHMGLPYLAAEGGLTEQDLLALAGKWGMPPEGKGCVMGVDQGNGLHVVIKEPHGDIVLTIRVHHEPMADPTFSLLDHFMETFDVRYCVIDALPNTHAARAFSRHFRGRVWLAYYADTQRGGVLWGFDQEGTPTVTINRTEALDGWRDVHKLRKRRIPRVEDEVTQYVRQMTNVLRKIEEDRETGQKKAVWIQRGPDHYAHADSYAEIALRRLTLGLVRGTLLG